MGKKDPTLWDSQFTAVEALLVLPLCPLCHLCFRVDPQKEVNKFIAQHLALV